MEVAKLKSSPLMPSVQPSLCLLPQTAWRLYTFKSGPDWRVWKAKDQEGSTCPSSPILCLHCALCTNLPGLSTWSHLPKWKWKLLSHVRLYATPWAVIHQAAQSMEFSRQEHWNGLPFPSAGDLLDSGIEPGPLSLQAGSSPSESPGKATIGHFQGPQDPTPCLPGESSRLLLLINGLYHTFPDLLPLHPSGAYGRSRLSFLSTEDYALCFSVGRSPPWDRSSFRLGTTSHWLFPRGPLRAPAQKWASEEALWREESHQWDRTVVRKGLHRQQASSAGGLSRLGLGCH